MSSGAAWLDDSLWGPEPEREPPAGPARRGVKARRLTASRPAPGALGRHRLAGAVAARVWCHHLVLVLGAVTGTKGRSGGILMFALAAMDAPATAQVSAGSDDATGGIRGDSGCAPSRLHAASSDRLGAH